MLINDIILPIYSHICTESLVRDSSALWKRLHVTIPRQSQEDRDNNNREESRSLEISRPIAARCSNGAGLPFVFAKFMKKFLAARYAFTKDVRKILAQFVSLAYYIHHVLSIDSGRAPVVCALRRINDDEGKIVLHRAFNFPHSIKGGSSTPLAELHVYVYLSVSHPGFFFSFFLFFPLSPYSYIHTFRLISPQDMSVQKLPRYMVRMGIRE